MPKSLCLVLKTKCRKQILILQNNPKHFYGQVKVLNSVLVKGLCSGGLVMKLCPTLCTPWTVTCQASLSMEFSRQDYWSGLPFPSPKLSKQGDNIQSCHTPFPILKQSIVPCLVLTVVAS